MRLRQSKKTPQMSLEAVGLTLEPLTKKKKSEGKPYQVYMTAGANKFLRIYYGKVKEYLAAGAAE